VGLDRSEGEFTAEALELLPHMDHGPVEDPEQADYVAQAINHVFGDGLGPAVPVARSETVLNALSAGIAGKLAVLDDGDNTWSRATAGLLGMPSELIATELTHDLVQEVMSRGAGGGPLEALARQLLSEIVSQSPLGFVTRIDHELELALVRGHNLAGRLPLVQFSAEMSGLTRQEAPEEADASTMPVTIYLGDDEIHEQVEAAVETHLAAAGLEVRRRDSPVVGSWFRRMVAGVKEVAHSPAARESALTAAHVADTRLVLAQDAAVTATLMQNLGPVLGALQPTKDAMIRAGAMLIVKVDWSVHVFQLTAAQQAILDHRPQLARSPHEVISALNLRPDNHDDARAELK
jgi:hypothetical protein